MGLDPFSISPKSAVSGSVGQSDADQRLQVCAGVYRVADSAASARQVKSPHGKYQPLADYLAGLKNDQVRLTFGEIEGYALCLWCDLMDESTSRISYDENVQELARDLEREARNPRLSSDRKSRVIQQARRARAFDDALDFSYRKARRQCCGGVRASASKSQSMSVRTVGTTKPYSRTCSLHLGALPSD